MYTLKYWDVIRFDFRCLNTLFEFGPKHASVSIDDSTFHTILARRNCIEKVHSIKQSIRQKNFNEMIKLDRPIDGMDRRLRVRTYWLYLCWPCTTKQSNSKNWKMCTLSITSTITFCCHSTWNRQKRCRFWIVVRL